MSTKNNSTPAKENALLTISNEEFYIKLKKRIEIGDEYMIISNKNELDNANYEFKIWNEYNSEMLKQVFNKDKNEYRSSYDHAGIHFMLGQLGEVVGDPIQSFKNKVK